MLLSEVERECAELASALRRERGEREKGEAAARERGEAERKEVLASLDRDRDVMGRRLAEEHDQRRIEQMEMQVRHGKRVLLLFISCSCCRKVVLGRGGRRQGGPKMKRRRFCPL